MNLQEFPSVSPNQTASVEMKIPIIATGATVGAQTEGSGPSDTDPTSVYATSPTSTVSGQVVSSMQAWAFGEASQLDLAIATELGRAVATEIDRQIITGTGSGAETLGLMNVSGATGVAYTDGTPTPPKVYQQIAHLASQVATARGFLPNIAIMHTRRWSWLTGELDSQNRPFLTPLIADLDDELMLPAGPQGQLAPGLRIYVTPTIPATLGAGTQDAIILINSADMLGFLRPPQFLVAPEASGELPNLQVRVTAYTYLASVPHRRKEGVGLLTGSGLIAPPSY
jgi:HK97 family phage major capsid protein